MTPWTVAYQAPLSMGFSRQEYWSGLPFPSPGDLPDQGLNSGLQHCKQRLYLLSHQEARKLIPSLISNYLNPPFGSQGKSRRLNEDYILQTRNGEHRTDLYSRVPQNPAQF